VEVRTVIRKCAVSNNGQRSDERICVLADSREHGYPTVLTEGLARKPDLIFASWERTPAELNASPSVTTLWHYRRQGLAEHGVTSHQIVTQITHGGVARNCFCAHNDANLLAL